MASGLCAQDEAYLMKCVEEIQQSLISSSSLSSPIPTTKRSFFVPPLEIKTFLLQEFDLKMFFRFHCGYPFQKTKFDQMTQRLLQMLDQGVDIQCQRFYTQMVEKRMTTFIQCFAGHYWIGEQEFEFHADRRSKDGFSSLIHRFCEKKYGSNIHCKPIGYKDWM